MQKILGIDLGATAIKATLVEASFRAHSVRSACRIPLDVVVAAEAPAAEGVEVPVAASSWSDRARVALAKLKADPAYAAEVVVCSLPAAHVATHVVTLPFGDPKRVEQTLPFELEGIIPLDLEEVVFDAHVLSRTPTRTELLVAVVRRDEIAATLAVLNEAGFDPATLTFSAATLTHLYAEKYFEPRVSIADDDGVEVMVDIGAERTDVLFVHDGKLQFARTLATGGHELTRALTRALAVSDGQAEQLKQQIDLSAADADPMMLTVLERAANIGIRELKTTFAAYTTRSRRKLSKVTLTGGGSHQPGIAVLLAKSLGLPVDLMQLTAARPWTNEQVVDTGSLSLALALRGLDSSQAEKFNFRKGAFAAQHAQSGWRDKVGVLAAMAAMLVVLMGVSSWANLRALEKREALLDDALCEATKKILGKCETDFRVALGKLKGKGSPAASIPSVSAVDLASAVSEVFPPGDDAVLSDFEVVDTTVTMRGDAKSFEAVDKLVESVQRNKCFSEIKKGNLTKGKSDRIEFKLDALYGCGAVKKAGT